VVRAELAARKQEEVRHMDEQDAPGGRAESPQQDSPEGRAAAKDQALPLKDQALPVNDQASPVKDQAGTTETVDSEAASLESRVKSGGSWFYWVAGLSLLNSAISLAGQNLVFVVGLGVMQFVDYFGNQIGMMGKILSLGVNIIIAAIIVLFGVLAQKKHAWAFIMGMILYALDGLLMLLIRDFMSFGFHCYALFCIYQGFNALNRLKRLEGRTS
jgi:hypothetical protein